ETHVSLDHVAHSLGAASTKNAMNWAKSQGMDLDNTILKSYVAGTSYPITNGTILGSLTFGLLDQGYTEKAASLFKLGSIEYSVAPRDGVATGVGLPWQIGSLSFGIGNTDTTGSNDVGIPLWGMIMGDHTRAYYRDEDVIRFLNKNEDVNSILNYQKKIWQGEKVKTKIISFSNENSANIKGEK
ncbi:hypothetical protein, partial [Actinobacillus porcinus]|uniref:hypothetical protein n=1 Tax=Actinobacillus porcinus TaxID=51048 RepID=UPI0023F0F7BF